MGVSTAPLVWRNRNWDFFFQTCPKFCISEAVSIYTTDSLVQTKKVVRLVLWLVEHIYLRSYGLETATVPGSPQKRV